MCILRYLKVKSTLRKYGKNFNTSEAIAFLQQINLSQKEKEWVKRIIDKFFAEDDKATLLVVLEVD